MEACIIAEPQDCVVSDDRVSRAQSGDLSAFEDLYRQHVGRIYGLCLRMTSDRQRAEELTQDAFTRAWERLGSFRGGAFGAWLHRLAVNVVYSNWRSRGRREMKETDFDDAIASERATPAPDPDRAVDLEQAIAQLPPKGRAVFVLHDVEGYRHQDISRLLGIASGTSKAQLHRARKLLREALQRS